VEAPEELGMAGVLGTSHSGSQRLPWDGSLNPLGGLGVFHSAEPQPPCLSSDR